jgi:hypothetical protein
VIATVAETELIFAVCRTYLWVRERGANRGEAVEHFLRRVGLQPGQPWCAAVFSTIGKDALEERWTLPMVGGCQYLAEQADTKGMLKAGPAPGAGFLLYYPKLGRFAHVGFLYRELGGGVWETFEGNTGRQGEREGYGFFEKERAFGPRDRFIHWWL